MYIEKQTFLVMGLSRSGYSATKFLLSRGAKVFIYDETKSERIENLTKELEELGAKLVSAELLHKAAEASDALVLSPGIPIDHPLAIAFKKNKKAVIGETELAARGMRCPIVAITGTNGKTTTVSMLTSVLNASGVEAYACGNIGTPMLDFVDLSEKSVAVAEISSFQLETLQSLCPHIAVVLNLTEDHLSRHYNMENYAFLKAKLLKNCSEMEYAVLNYDDEIVRGFAQKTKAKIVWFSLKERVRGAYFENGDLYFGTEKVISSADLCLEGAHNVQNALAVIAAAKIMGVDTQILAKSLSNFQGIKHRIEKVGVVGDVLCIDDSKGTNVDATIKAIQCMKTQTVLLLGGKNKGYDYTKLFFAMKKYPIVHAVLYGENRFELLKSAQAGTFENFTLCDKFALAVEIAFLKAKAGQTILLSPASASFDEFASYEERGDKFVEIVCAHAKKREIIENSKEEVGANIEKEQSKTEPTIVCNERDEPLHSGEEHAKENRFAPVGEENE